VCTITLHLNKQYYCNKHLLFSLIKKVLHIFFLLIAGFVSIGQVLPEKGVPDLENYIPSDYKNMGKVWDIGSSPNGLVYYATDKGLLEYDGKSWNGFKGSKGITRSVLVVNDNLIYTGSDLDFGVWKKTGLYSFEYESLYPFKDDVQEKIEEFWNVFHIKDMIVFVSSQNLYLYKDEQITKIKSPISISSSFKHNDTIYFADNNSGLYYFDKLDIKEALLFSNNLNILGIFDYNKKHYFVSNNEGLFNIENQELSSAYQSLSTILKEAKVFSFEQIGDSYLAFGTILKGIIITDLEGNIIHQINKIKGLLSNTILSLHYSINGKLWLGLDYGISSLFMFNNFTYFYDFRGDFGTGFVASRVKDMFYLGTNQGLYYSSWKDLNDNEAYSFNLIPGSEGQVWSLLEHDDQLFIGHDQGLYSLKNNKLTSVHYQDGIWTIIPYGDYLLAGSYNGISIFNKSDGKWMFHKKMDLILGSCNQLISFNNNLWVNIPNYGVIQIELDSSLKPQNQNIYSASEFSGSSPYLVVENDTLYVLTDKSVYYFDKGKLDFQACENIFNQPKPDNILTGVYLPSPLCEDYAFYPIYNGFAFKYLADDLKYHVEEKPLLRKIEAFNNKELVELSNNARIPFKLNNIRISFVLPNVDNVLFQYRLNNESNWSEWTDKDNLNFFSLESDVYNFELRAKIGNQITESTTFTFEILNPWLKSWQAYSIYLLLSFLLVLFFILLQKRLLKKAKAKLILKEEKAFNNLEKKHKAELLKIEQEKIQNEYEQLKQQLRNKTIELAKKSKENEDKNRFLISIQEKIQEIQDNPQIAKSRISEVSHLINSFIQDEDNTFELQMDELHQEFFKNIKKDFPDLSSNDLRLCVYIRVGLSSKEIASILNIQPSSSYISRSRLRKKLNLNTEDDLYDFLNKY
jgi:AraC family chitin signaling transcriptional activator